MTCCGRYVNELDVALGVGANSGRFMHVAHCAIGERWPILRYLVELSRMETLMASISYRRRLLVAGIAAGAASVGVASLRAEEDEFSGTAARCLRHAWPT